MATLKDFRSDEQIRKDRWAALAVVVAFLLFLGIVVLATIFGEAPTEPIEDWFLMP